MPRILMALWWGVVMVATFSVPASLWWMFLGAGLLVLVAGFALSRQ